MRDEHIISMLEETPLAGLSESELATIRAHGKSCPDCRRAYEAAQISALLLKGRVAETFEPSPFFQTRVLASLREQQQANETWALGRLWRTAGALVSTMAATVAALTVLTFVIPATQTPQNMTSVLNGYSAEEVILNQNNLPDEQTADDLSDDQVFRTLYAAEEDTVK